MNHRTFLPWRTLLVAVLLMLHAASSAVAAVSQEEVENVRAAAEELSTAARERLEALPEGETKTLKAVVMAVKGKSQWRPDAEAAWKDAKVDDLLDPGAMIRTGRNSAITLRVGQNATVLVDRNTRLQLPQIIQEGQTLRTAIQVTRGKADFKVDRIGLTNDFSVVTPSATLAVRGTGYAVEYGGFNGTEISASRLNEMFAIELRYFVSRFAYYLSRGGASSEQHQNPALNELFKSFGPPRLVSALLEQDATADQLMNALMSNPIWEEWTVDQALENLEELIDEITEEYDDEEFIFDFDFEDWNFEGVEGAGQVAEFIYFFAQGIFDLWSQYLIRDGLGNEGLDQAMYDIDAIGQGVEVFTEQQLIDMLNVVVAYCSTQHSDQQAANQCVINFITATAEWWVENEGGGFGER